MVRDDGPHSAVTTAVSFNRVVNIAVEAAGVPPYAAERLAGRNCSISFSHGAAPSVVVEVGTPRLPPTPVEPVDMVGVELESSLVPLRNVEAPPVVVVAEA